MNLASTFTRECESSEDEKNEVDSGSKKLKEVVFESEEDKKKEGNKANLSLCWPRDWLPQDCPGARVIALNYTTDRYLWQPVWMAKRYR